MKKNIPAFQPDPSNWWNYSFNQWWGCEKISPACANCYAETFDRFAGRHLDPRRDLHWGPGAPRLFIEGFGASMRSLNTLYEHHCEWPRPRVFVNSMNDWLDPAVPERWLWNLLSVIRDCKSMDHLLLTKRPEFFRPRLEAVHKQIPEARHDIDWWLSGGIPTQVWVGATVESQKYANERIPELLRIPAKRHFLSCEPLLGPLDLPLPLYYQPSTLNSQPASINWIIAGGESGGQARPSDPDWFHGLHQQCLAAGVPFWFKQWGEWVGGKFDSRKSKVMLQDGRVFWLQSGKPYAKLHGWQRQIGPFGVVSCRVGMRPVKLDSLNVQAPPRFTDNHLLDGQIIRELPTEPSPSVGVNVATHSLQ